MIPVAAETTSSRWLRVVKIVAVFVVIGPMIASIGLFIGVLIEGMSNPRYAVPLGKWPEVWWGWLAVSFMAGAPYALLTGGAFALLAVFAGLSGLWVAIAAVLAPMPLIHLLPPIGEPIWRQGWFFALTAIAILVVSSTICWLLSRRWHGQLQ